MSLEINKGPAYASDRLRMDPANAANGCGIPLVIFSCAFLKGGWFMQKKTAKYKLITDSNGKFRFQFFCDLSGALEYTSNPIGSANHEKELELVWNKEAKAHFNVCHKCGKLVGSEMFNAEVFECVACAPWEDAPKYCPHCGQKVIGAENKCTVCGKSLRYEGEEE